MKGKMRFLTTANYIAATLFFSISAIAASGDVDVSFGGALINEPAERATLAIVQPDNKIIVFGSFDSVNGSPVHSLVRLNADGTLDSTFNAPAITASVVGLPAVKAIGLQSDGKIIIGGLFDRIGGVVVYALARLNTDGSRDTTFADVFDTSRDVNDIAVLSDDHIIVGASPGFYKLTPNGGVDPSFSSTNEATRIWQLEVQPDGKIIYFNFTDLRRFNSDGTTDDTFQTGIFGGGIGHVTVQSDGKILVGGNFVTVNGFSKPKLVRFNSDGMVDAAFNHAFLTSGIVYKILPLSDGSIVIGGVSLNNASTSNNFGLYKLNSSGSIDPSFNPANNNGTVYDLDLLADGKIFRSSIQPISSQTGRTVARLNSDGSYDNSFQTRLGRYAIGWRIFVQPDGKILAGGDFRYANNIAKSGLARFNADGSVDNGFNPTFIIPEGDALNAIDVQPDGKIVVGFFSLAARRLNADGSPDITFESSSQTRDIKVLSSGKILIAGSTYLRLFNSNGTLDSSFNVTLNGSAIRIAIQTDGKILVAGNFTQVNSINRNRIVRLNSDGSVDATFNPSSGANGEVSALDIQSDGKVLIGGFFTGVNFTNRAYLARLNTDGSLDTSFLPTPNFPVYTIFVQPNNKILFGGSFSIVNGVNRSRLARLNPNGSLDAVFNRGDGPNRTVRSIDLQDDGKVLIGGEFSRINGVSKLGIARLENSLTDRTPFDFDGDGRADFTVFRPSTNIWYGLQSSNWQVTQTTFGISGDILAPADFDGDGKTDLGIYRPLSGDWWYAASNLGGAHRTTQWGVNGDIPRPSDYDGDGKADFVVYRPSNGTWYRKNSLGDQSAIAFGAPGDQPLVGDFDGDGKSDPAIFRPSTGAWWYAASSAGNQHRSGHWGQIGDIPVPADFDGDGKTDFAVFRPSEGGWYILNSSDLSARTLAFGLSGDRPIAADYDGDGQADVAVFRPSDGIWYLLQSTAGFGGVQWGISTDTPAQSAFLP